MKKLIDVFPKIYSTNNDSFIMIQEAFDKQYSQLKTEEEKEKLISDFKNILCSLNDKLIDSKEHPIKIEGDKHYYFDDYFMETE